MKAPPETPFSVLAIVELARQAGVPDGVINVVLTDKHVAAVGKEMCENETVKKISFTGSVRCRVPRGWTRLMRKTDEGRQDPYGPVIVHAQEAFDGARRERAVHCL